MVSLKKFLDADSVRFEALERMVGLVLQGILVHSVEGAPEDFASLRDSLGRISEAVAEAQSGQDYLIQAGAVISSLDRYRRQTDKYFEQRRAETKNIIHMLTATITAISNASKESLQRLRRIGEDISAAAQIEDVRLIKSKLGECLDDIRNEAERQKAHMTRMVEELSGGLRKAQTSVLFDWAGVQGNPGANPGGQSLDPVTGLPGRNAAESAIESASQGTAPVAVAVIVIGSLPAINIKYGRSAGDQVLQAFGDYIAQKLAPEDDLFRWTGPTLLALLRRPVRVERARAEFARLMEQKFEHTIQTPSHVIHFAVAKRWSVLPLDCSPAQLYRNIDTFIGPTLERN